MASTSMIKQLSSSTSGVGGLEAALVNQLGAFYTANTYQVLELSNHSDFGGTCVIGSIIDPEHNIPVPFAAVNTAGEGLSSATWGILNGGGGTGQGLRGSMDFTVDPLTMQEQSGLFGLVEIPLASTNWNGFSWMAVGYVYDSTGAQNLSPIIIEIMPISGYNVASSEVYGLFPPSAWVLTSYGTSDTKKPSMLCDVVYDAPNDAIVAVGSVANTAATVASLSMFVELLSSGVAPTYMWNSNFGTSNDTRYPAFLRSCAIQTQDAAGATVANRTIVSAVGFLTDAKWGTWFLYQPNFSNAWAGNPRWAVIEKGLDEAAEFFSQQGLDANDKPTYMTFCKRLTEDGEDIYIIGGISPNGITSFGISGLFTDSTGGGNDNIINNTGVSTTLQLSEVKNISGLIRTNSAFTGVTGNYDSTASTSAITDFVAIGSGRRTKLYSVGYETNGRNAARVPAAYPDEYAFIMAISRGLIQFNTEVTTSGEAQSLFSNKSSGIKMSALTQTTLTEISYADYSLEPTATGSPSEIIDVSIATGNRAVAWFEYLMYDGVDALVARKLHEMGVRVTIANVEWYKQDILKQSLDVSSDFFTEWATEQQGQNRQRDRLAELQGSSRPRKRQVRTEVFDDYADMEEKEAAVKNFPDYDPFKDGEPFKDDVEREQEIQKTQKAVDDLRRIEDTIEGADEVQSEQREQDGAYDIGDNEEP